MRSCASPHVTGNTGRQREEADPGPTELCAFPKPPAKRAQGCKGPLWQPEAGLSFKSLFLPKSTCRIDAPGSQRVLCPHKGGITGGGDGSCTSETCPCCAQTPPPDFLMQRQSQKGHLCPSRPPQRCRVRDREGATALQSTESQGTAPRPPRGQSGPRRAFYTAPTWVLPPPIPTGTRIRLRSPKTPGAHSVPLPGPQLIRFPVRRSACLVWAGE